MKQYKLRKKELKDLVAQLQPFGYQGDGREFFIIDDKERLVLADQQVMFFSCSQGFVPTLHAVRLGLVALLEVVVDMGAVRFISSGADVMRPGIRDFPPDLKTGQVVKVVDEKNHVALCVARALTDAQGMAGSTTGKVLENLQHVGDKRWEFGKES